MAALQEKSSDCSESTEKLTIAYTESVCSTSSGSSGSSESSTESSSSISSESSGSLLSMSAVYDIIEEMRRKDEASGYTPVWRTMSLTEGTKVRALDYFRSHSIYQLFSFMMSQLLVNAPSEPIPFLVSLLDRCLQYRDGDGRPPLLFESRHVESLYTALDPLEDGAISYEQYLNGMTTLGLSDFKAIPFTKIILNSGIEKSKFISEAEKELLNQLDRLLGKSLQKDAPQSENLGDEDQNGSEPQLDRQHEDNFEKNSTSDRRSEENNTNRLFEEKSIPDFNSIPTNDSYIKRDTQSKSKEAKKVTLNENITSFENIALHDT